MSVVISLILIASVLVLSRSAFSWGFYSSQLMHSEAMIRHHERMLEVLDHGQVPDFKDVQQSLDILRQETRRDPSFRTDFLGVNK